MKKILIGFFLAFSIFLFPRSVLAYTTSNNFPESNYSNLDSFVTSEVLSKFYNDFYDNSSINSLGLTKENSMFFISYDTSSNTYYFYSCIPQTFIDVGNGCICPFGGSGNSLWGVYSHISPSQLDSVSSLEFSRTDYSLTSSATYKPVFCYDSSLRNYYRCQVRLWYSGVFGSVCNLEPSYNPPTNPYTNYPAAFLFNYSEPYFPEYETSNSFLHIDTEDFYTWLIDNNKVALDSSSNVGKIPYYIGVSKLKAFIEFYNSFGSSNSGFLKNIVSWFSHFNIISQSRENIRILKSTTDQLYSEYLNYLSSSHAYWPGATKIQERNSIDTVTNNTDTSLITDSPSDDIITSILRDILRGVIAVSNNINQGVFNICSKLDQLSFTVNVANNGGSDLIDLNPILTKMDDIIEALGSDTVSVEIDQTTKDDTDDFFDDWNLQFTTALNNKFPVASQLRTFFTGFFERCGIDADSDGEVYQYYNPGVLTASSVSRSAGTATVDDIVTEFLGKFDNSDPSFLDDASFHGVPDLSVSVGGQSVSIIDFRVYAKYREKIHFIISFVIWTLYLLHLYKALPQIIGQVADVAVKTSDL